MSAPSIEVGGEIEEVPTEVTTLCASSQSAQLIRLQHLGFRALAKGSEGPKKLQILKPWPADRMPPSCATLLSIASEPGLLAAAGPDSLIVTSTEKVRKAFSGKAGEWDVITDFTPDVTIPLGASPLRHVAFSTGGEFLVISAEEKGALAVFDASKLMQGSQAPERQIPTDGVAVRSLLANPVASMGHYMAAVLDTGKLWVVDVDQDKKIALKEEGVCCATWSSRGKAVAAGLEDGTTQIFLTDGTLKGTIPRPPGVDENYQVTGLAWLQTSELLIVHSPKVSADDSKYHMVECNKTWNAFEFHATGFDPLFLASDAPARALPPRISATRLQKWEPDLDDMLILTSSHTDTIEILSNPSKPWSEAQTELNYGKWVLTPLEDTRKAAVPRLVFGEEGDSLLVGEALDLSATEKILRPIPALEEINEAPHPLPAYMVLTHQGVIMPWWVVWNRSVEQGTRYPGLVSGSEGTTSTPQVTKQAELPTPAKPQQTSTFGQPSTPSAAAPVNAFAKAAATFGSPSVSVPSFGAPGLGSTPPFLPKTTQPFGSASNTPAVGKPAAPAFGSPSMIGAPKTSGFGAVGGMGNKASPWAAPSQDAPAAQTPANPFSGGGTGFAKFGQAGGNNSFSSFGSNNGAQSGFGSFGQQQKPGFPGLKTEPSGSTVTLGSATGSSLPSWAGTPAQGGSAFGGFGGLTQSKSSFNTSSFESKTSEASAASDRKRDEATPTPQSAQGLFGGGFSLGSTFKPDGTAKDDLPKPAAPSTGSLFGSDFASGLGGSSSNTPTTPAKEPNKVAAQDVSTTPASPPRQQKSFFPTPAKESATPRAPPPVDTGSKSDDAPLPPDFLTSKPAQSADDDLPPLAGSPGVKVEAPSSSVEASPIDHEDDDEESGFSEEEDDEETGEDTGEVGEPSPSDASRRPQSRNREWSLQNSMAKSTREFPPAPTPPAVKSGATSTSGRSASPAQPLFGQSSKPAQASSLFGQQPQKGPLSFGNTGLQSSTPAKQPLFPPPTNRPQANLRSPSPVRSASTSALRTRRDPIAAPGSSLSASIQAKPPTPQPEVQDLEDEEDERMREQLAQPIEPSMNLDDFVAYQNYTGTAPNKTGTAAQIEMIYKDINGMIDSLGWNARSVKSFIEYHRGPQPGHRVDRSALEDVEDDGEDGSWFEQWALCEIDNLKSLEDELERELDAGRVQDVFDKLGQLARLLHDKAKLTTRLNEIRRQIVNRKDPDRVEATRKAPLSKEMADKQKELRNEYARLLKLLNQAEEGSVFLKSRLASYCAQNGKGNNVPVPTVDAIKKTIVKMIAVAEKRNNDITLVESQLRKLAITESNRSSSPTPRTLGTPRKSRSGGTSLRSSMIESPFATPPTSRAKMSLSELNRRALTPDVDATPTAASKGYGLSYSPDGAAGSGNELARMSDMVDENIETLRATARRRKQVAGGLKRALIERGVKTTKVA
jgi:nucleoporin NUP159